MIKSKKISSIDAVPLNDENLSYVLIKFSEGNYFSVCYMMGESDTISIEYCDQPRAINSNNINYLLLENNLIFSFDDEIATKIQYNANMISIELNLKDSERKLLEESLQAVFKHKNSSS